MAYRSGPHEALPNIRIERRSDERLLHVKLTGATAFQDFAAAVAAAGTALAQGPAHGVMIDLRASKYAPSQGEAQRLGEQVASLRQAFRGPVALLAGSMLQFGVCRMIAAFAESAAVPAAAFQNETEALAWIADAGRTDEASKAG